MKKRDIKLLFANFSHEAHRKAIFLQHCMN